MEERMRDAMVFLANSVIEMLQSASWTVFIPDNLLKELGAKRFDHLCGYAITYFHKDESTTEIEIVPVRKGKKKYIILKTQSCIEWYEYKPEKEHDIFVQIHEKIAALVNLPEERR